MPDLRSLSAGKRVRDLDLAALAKRGIAAAPERLTLILTGLAVASAITVTLGAFRPYTTLPLATVLIGLAWFTIPRGPRDDRSALGSGIALGGSLLWFVANAHWVAEYLIVRRDPGFLTLSALWLRNHPSTDIPSLGTESVVDGVRNVLADAPEAWNLNGDVIQPQGAKLLPALAAVGGWLDGMTGVLLANLVIGAIGLLATYALARHFMGPIAALVPAVGLSLTVSHMWLSRADFTEPITMVLLLAAIAWAWKGVENGRTGPLIASGVASGSTLLARIDGPVFGLGVAVGVAIALAMSRLQSRGRRASAFLAFALAQAAMTLVGHLSIWRWSRAYVERLGSETRELEMGYAAAIVLLILAAIVLPIIGDRRYGRRAATTPGAGASDGDQAPERRGVVAYLPHVLAVGMALAFAVLISRPQWMMTHTSDPNAFQIPVVASWQASQGLPVDGTRTYGESTLTWTSYYLTWPVILLGVAGLTIGAWRLGKGRGLWAIPLAGFLIPSLLYIVRPAIIPDQVWAIRRLYASLLVGLLIFAAVAWQAAIVRMARARRAVAEWRDVVWIALAAIIAAAPFTTWYAITHQDGWGIKVTNALGVAEQKNARAQIDELCAYIDGRPVILAGTASHFGTIRVACDVPVVLALTDLSKDDIAKMESRYQGETVVLTRTLSQVPWATTPTTPTFHSRVYYSTSSLRGLPFQAAAKQDFDWYVGVARPDGSVAFVPGTTP